MPNAASLRSQVESQLAGRVPAPFLYRDRKVFQTVSSGIPEIDALAGGLSRGSLTELCGPPCSGLTSVLVAALAARTSQPEACALIDGRDSFDPHSAAAAGVQLENLLWVRCRTLDQSLRAADLLLQGGGFGLIALDLTDIAPETVRRVPLNAWFRFRRGVEDTPTILLLLDQEPNAKTCASLVLSLSMDSARWSATGDVIGVPQFPHGSLLKGLHSRAQILRTRVESFAAETQPNHLAPHRPYASSYFRTNAESAFEAQTIWSYPDTHSPSDSFSDSGPPHLRSRIVRETIRAGVEMPQMSEMAPAEIAENELFEISVP